MWRMLFCTAVLGIAIAGSAYGASLRVAPVGFELVGETSATTLRVWNDEAQPVAVQVRVFKWDKGGSGRLEPTSDVVASPPMTTLTPGAENLIRIVRVANTPIAPGESYRLLVDELPRQQTAGSGRVQVVVRHSIPITFGN